MAGLVIALVGLILFGILSVIQIHMISKSRPTKFKSWTAYGHIEVEYETNTNK